MIGWDVLVDRWNRTTRYEDLLDMGNTISSLPHPSYSNTASSLSSGRIVVMIHCGPKTGSTTLRAACQSNLEETCGVKKRGRFPAGYMDESVLYPLIRRCVNTTHFCVKEISMSPTEVPTYREDVSLFVHMFPFREYDAWAESAMKQQYDRGGSRACDRTSKLLQGCEHNNMEIDFRKYGKVRLSEFKDDVLRRAEEGMDESHAFLLYHHLDLTDVLRRLSDVYGVPLLPKSNERYKGKRPEGNCDARLLEMFHDCFSSRLMKLK